MPTECYTYINLQLSIAFIVEALNRQRWKDRRGARLTDDYKYSALLLRRHQLVVGRQIKVAGE